MTFVEIATLEAELHDGFVDIYTAQACVSSSDGWPYGTVYDQNTSSDCRMDTSTTDVYSEVVIIKNVAIQN